MKLDVQVQGRKVATLFRERDDYVLQYEPDAAASDFVSLTMPVRQEAWRWPRDLHPFFRQIETLKPNTKRPRQMPRALHFSLHFPSH